MSVGLIVAIVLLVVVLVVVNLEIAREQLRRADAELEPSDEEQAAEHARPLGNVVPLRPLEPEERRR